MEYIKIPVEFTSELLTYSYKEIGRLFTAMLRYATTGEQSDIRGNERTIWPRAKELIDQQKEVLQGRMQYGAAGRYHPNWKGGITPRNQKERNSRKYHEWRQAVFHRDGFTCQCCGIRGGNLNAHHIEPWAKFKEKRYEVTNGITLYVACHKQAHRK